LKAESDYTFELYRKLIHLVSTVVPVIYFFTSRDYILALVGTGTLLMIILDLLKAYTVTFEKLYIRVFGSILRDEEKNFKRNLFTGGTYYALGIFLALLLFPKEVAILSILIMIWCDTTAALIGKKYGKHKMIGDKSLEGSLAFLITGILLVFILQYVFVEYRFYYAGFVTVFLAAVFEQIGFVRINDNLSLPVFSGIVFQILNNFI